MAKGECQTTNKGSYQEEDKDEKRLQPLDEDDIALLKTYVRKKCEFLLFLCAGDGLVCDWLAVPRSLRVWAHMPQKSRKQRQTSRRLRRM